MGWCIVLVNLPRCGLPQIGYSSSHTLTKGRQNLGVIMLIDRLILRDPVNLIHSPVTLVGWTQEEPHWSLRQHFCTEGHSRSWVHSEPHCWFSPVGGGHVPVFWIFREAGQHTPNSDNLTIFGRNEASSAPGVRWFLRKVLETGMLMDNRSHPRARPVRTAERIAAVAQSVRENPRTSTRHRAQQLNVSRTSLRRILHKDLGLFAYKLQLTQEVKENDHPLRCRFTV
ncbi:hypothetical protein NQ318_004053 [Aromia moschata]|uniref:Uncharacterized protein n=1 Tax=Aromia moschata TaxID=1265417 RepID=A0AAV8Z936_9CUCU|nr:hypothetical protein NQ318_004053 [Aromia moschata]